MSDLAQSGKLHEIATAVKPIIRHVSFRRYETLKQAKQQSFPEQGVGPVPGFHVD
jgi:hypothetical protein